MCCASSTPSNLSPLFEGEEFNKRKRLLWLNRKTREYFLLFFMSTKYLATLEIKIQKEKFRLVMWRWLIQSTEKCFKFPFTKSDKICFRFSRFRFTHFAFPEKSLSRSLFLSIFCLLKSSFTCQHLLLERMFRRLVDGESFSMMFAKRGAKETCK